MSGRSFREPGKGVKYARLESTDFDVSMGGSRRHRLNNNDDGSGGVGFGSFLDGPPASSNSSMGNVDSAYGGSPAVNVRQFRFSMRVCGPKLSLCGVLLSVWGILQLGFMWIALSVKSVAFVEDVAFNETLAQQSPTMFDTELDEGYRKAANNCKVAALLYLVVLVVSLHQRWLNSRPTPQAYTRYA